MNDTSKKKIQHISMIFKNLQESIQKRLTQFNCKTWVHKKATLFLFHFVVYIDSRYQLQTQVSRILFFYLITITFVKTNYISA
jgi:hypothetical protein